MTAVKEIRQVRMGEHFREDALPKVAQIFDELRVGDLSLTNGRHVFLNFLNVPIRASDNGAYLSQVAFVAKDYPSLGIARKAAVSGIVIFSSGEERKVITKIEEVKDGLKRLSIRDSLWYLGGGREEISASFTFQDDLSTIDDAERILYKNGQEPTRVTQLFSRSSLADTALGHAWEIIESSESKIKREIFKAIAKEITAKEVIKELLE